MNETLLRLGGLNTAKFVSTVVASRAFR